MCLAWSKCCNSIGGTCETSNTSYYVTGLMFEANNLVEISVYRPVVIVTAGTIRSNGMWNLLKGHTNYAKS